MTLTKSDILNKIEILVVTKYLNRNAIRYLNQVALHWAVRRFNLPGMWLDDLPADVAPIALHIDCPLGQNSTEARLALIESYLEFTPHPIADLNIGLLAKFIIDKDYESLTDDTEIISSTINNSDPLLPHRYFIDLKFMDSDEEVLRIANIIEQAGCKSVVLGTMDKKINSTDIPIVAHRIKKNTGLNVSIFGDFNNLGTLEELNKMPFQSILVPPSTIFEQFVKKGV